MPGPIAQRICLLTIAALMAGSETPARATEPTKTDFSKDIIPVLEKHCIKCHSGAKAKGGVSLTFKNLAEAGKKPQLWEKVTEQLRSGEMPPSGRPKLAAEELELLTTWIHADMLGGDCQGPRDPGRVTVRRLNRADYNNTIRDLLFVKNFKPADDFPSDDVGYGFDNIGDVLSLSPLLLEKYLAAAESAVELAFQNPENRAKWIGTAKGKTRKLDRAQTIIEAFLSCAYRRPAEPGEVARLLRFVELAQQNGETFEKGIQLAFQAALVSPYFLFRVEIDRNNLRKEPFAVKPLSDYELASRLSYFLWSSMPDEALFKDCITISPGFHRSPPPGRVLDVNPRDRATPGTKHPYSPSGNDRRPPPSTGNSC